jgi:protein TonB
MTQSYVLNRDLDRLSVSTLLALLVHGALLFGLGFALERSSQVPPRLEITLAPHKSLVAPEHADFLAQHNQQGSGTLEERQELTTTDLAPLEDNVIRETSETVARPAQIAQLVPNTVLSRQDSLARMTAPMMEQSEETSGQSAVEQLFEEPEQQIQSLEARLDQQRRAYTRRPKVHRITSVATLQSDDARYQFEWQQKVELVGNKYYPEEARRKKFSGDVRLVVALLPDGSIKRIDVLSSSGKNVLDQAAIRSVKLAAPFAPFPSELREKADILEIIRTWQFRNNVLSSRG